MRDALAKIFDSYKDKLVDAKDLIPERRQQQRD
jgi:hypothetical protein